MRIFIIILLTSQISFSQTKTEINSEKETALFLKQILKKDSLNIWVKESTKSSWLSECYVSKNAGFLKKNEISTINQKLKKDCEIPWTHSSTLNLKIVKDTLFEKSDRDVLVKELNQNILIISHPIFFRNGKYCILFYQYVCGNICGTSSLALYEKVNERWEIKQEYCDMIN
ncbi:hypothetical protein [Flavobacterium lacus]|uniref:Uncharacterized protein n=1 Tax=Flavobacterium lacus TaxID=1353778 RepID=A0A328WQL7_9FLAO|nr:hypothetical protein [Flavobacterium lacus]RAR48541.1 hypothetical protein B0I10_105152 [Flavobacterium lacus]